MRQQVDDAIRVAKEIATGAHNVVFSSWLAITDWDAIASSDLETKQELLKDRAECLVSAVVHDLENVAKACEYQQSLDGLLFHDGTSSDLADRLAVHSRGSGRIVAAYATLPVKCSLAAMAGKLSAWIFHAGSGIRSVFLTVTDFDLPTRSESGPLTRPTFWRHLAERVESASVTPSVQIGACVLIAQQLATKRPSDIIPFEVGNAAIEELLTFRETIGETGENVGEVDRIQAKNVAGRNSGKGKRGRRGDPPAWRGMAIVKIMEDPRKCDKDIAEAVGVHPGTLSRDEQYQAVAQRAREDIATTRRGILNDGKVDCEVNTDDA